MYAELSELSTKEFSSQSGSISPKKSSVAESSTARVGHFSNKNVDIGKIFFKMLYTSPKSTRKRCACTCKD